MTTQQQAVQAIKPFTKRGEFKMAIGSPTNQERTYLTGEGVLVGKSGEVLVHTLPVYRQKDYPNYQVRKQGPYVVSMVKCGLRISATAEKMVFANEEDAVGFAESVVALFALFGLSFNVEDPRPVLEKAKELKEQVYQPMKTLAEQHNAQFIQPQA